MTASGEWASRMLARSCGVNWWRSQKRRNARILMYSLDAVAPRESSATAYSQRFHYAVPLGRGFGAFTQVPCAS